MSITPNFVEKKLLPLGFTKQKEGSFDVFSIQFNNDLLFTILGIDVVVNGCFVTISLCALLPDDRLESAGGESITLYSGFVLYEDFFEELLESTGVKNCIIDQGKTFYQTLCSWSGMDSEEIPLPISFDDFFIKLEEETNQQ